MIEKKVISRVIQGMEVESPAVRFNNQAHIEQEQEQYVWLSRNSRGSSIPAQRPSQGNLSPSHQARVSVVSPLEPWFTCTCHPSTRVWGQEDRERQDNPASY